MASAWLASTRAVGDTIQLLLVDISTNSSLADRKTLHFNKLLVNANFKLVTNYALPLPNGK